MAILALHETQFIDDDYVKVTALVEDAILLYPGSHEDPAEYGPGVCQAGFYVAAEESIPTDEVGFIDFLESINLDWHLVDMSDY